MEKNTQKPDTADTGTTDINRVNLDSTNTNPAILNVSNFNSPNFNSMDDNLLDLNSPNFNSINLAGMSGADAKEYILSFIATLKLTENEIRSLEAEAAKWKNRVELARSCSREDLAAEAEKEADRVNMKLAGLRDEEQTLRERIGVMQRQLPGLAARERSIDPDLLEQELLMALGRTEKEAETERAFSTLEKDRAADAALEALKGKMKDDAQ